MTVVILGLLILFLFVLFRFAKCSKPSYEGLNGGSTCQDSRFKIQDSLFRLSVKIFHLVGCQ